METESTQKQEIVSSQTEGTSSTSSQHETPAKGTENKDKNNPYPKSYPNRPNKAVQKKAHRHPNNNKEGNKKQKNKKNQQKPYKPNKSIDLMGGLNTSNLNAWEVFANEETLKNLASELSSSETPFLDFNQLYNCTLQELVEKLEQLAIQNDESLSKKSALIYKALQWAYKNKIEIKASGLLELLPEGNGVVVFEHDNYAIRKQSIFIHSCFIKKYGLLRGDILDVQIHPPRENGNETCPFAIKIKSIMGVDPESFASKRTLFEDLVPYYPTERLLLETNPNVPWDNLSMRVIDILTPVGLGQRGLIVAPPRTGKTVLLQSIAHAISLNRPEAHLIVLLIDERPEEVTDFKRQVEKGEVLSSTFDETPESHVHVAEMAIEKARRMVEVGKHVVILLDSITRLARAYNALMPSSGKILSGGVEANALQKPKRFFGSARNIEEGGSLTILASALIETGSRMDDVIFEEFKGTGNMEIHLEKELVNKRLFPAINIDKSGTRKEELLYHPEELNRVYGLRRAMKGLPPVESMEMLIARMKKIKTNTEFLLSLNR